tara:strand:+ start:810 stop:1121 length:312 start_codon:yes stop_codon:yes gene_type:complete
MKVSGQWYSETTDPARLLTAIAHRIAAPCTFDSIAGAILAHCVIDSNRITIAASIANGRGIFDLEVVGPNESGLSTVRELEHVFTAVGLCKCVSHRNEGGTGC